MTDCTKPVTRQVSVDKDRVFLAITLYPSGTIGFRERGSKKEYTVSSLSCYRLAVEMDNRVDKKHLP